MFTIPTQARMSNSPPTPNSFSLLRKIQQCVFGTTKHRAASRHTRAISTGHTVYLLVSKLVRTELNMLSEEARMQKFTFGICSRGRYCKPLRDIEVRLRFSKLRHTNLSWFRCCVGCSGVQFTAFGNEDLTSRFSIVQTHPTRDIIATASMEKDLTIRLWFDDAVVDVNVMP